MHCNQKNMIGVRKAHHSRTEQRSDGKVKRPFRLPRISSSTERARQPCDLKAALLDALDLLFQFPIDQGKYGSQAFMPRNKSIRASFNAVKLSAPSSGKRRHVISNRGLDFPARQPNTLLCVRNGIPALRGQCRDAGGPAAWRI